MCATLAHVTETRKPAALYLRISLDREGRSLGVERQEAACRELCARLGLDVTAVYRDNDRSASKYARKTRPEYAAMLAAVHAGEIGVIVAYSSSRLTRRLRDALDLIDLAEAGAVEIRTVVSGQYDLSTAAGRTIAKVFAVFDEQESEVNSERSLAERKQRRERGMPNGGTRPFGFLADCRTPHPREYPALQRGAADALAGVNLTQIAREWSAVKGSTVTSSTVRRVLLSERLAGKLPDGRPAVWDPVVSADTAAALRGLLDRPATTHAATQLLTGHALCGGCGAPVRGAVNRHRVGCYECSATPHLRVRRAERDAFAIDLIADYLDRERVEAAADTAPLTTRHAALEQRLGEVADAFADGELTREQSRRATDRLRGQLAEVEEQLATFTRASTLPGSGAAFRALPVARQRAVLGALPWRIVLDPPGRGARYFDPVTVRVEPR